MIALLAALALTNATWATPLDKPGLPNLHQVSATLYRGAQPTAEGMKHLERIGVKTVINLRSFNSDRPELAGTRLRYQHLWVKAWHPEDKEVVAFLRMVTDTNATPAFVHCQHGADRTGTMCAIYRIAVQGWTKDQALAEMTGGGFGYHTVWKNLITYIRNLDIDALKAKAGLSAAPARRVP
jgi:protein tyrosine/serine phosphatase